MCGSCGDAAKGANSAYTRMVMTIREKFADLRFLVSKYKGGHMAF